MLTFFRYLESRQWPISVWARWGRVTCFLGNWFTNSLQCQYSGESIQSNSSAILLKGSGESIQSNSNRFLQIIQFERWNEKSHGKSISICVSENLSISNYKSDGKCCLTPVLNCSETEIHLNQWYIIGVIQFNRGNMMHFDSLTDIFWWLGLNRFPSDWLESWIPGRTARQLPLLAI